jgi:Uma2 family endonuclease
MAASNETRQRTLLTAEDLYELPDDDMRRELVRGELRVSEPPGWGHGTIAIRLAARLHAHVEANRLGFVTGEAGYVLERGPDTVRGPDVAFIRAERRPGPDVEHRYFEGAPDLAVEIVSPKDRASEVAETVDGYLARGTRLVWVIYPPARRVVAHTPGGVATPLGESDLLDGRDVVPGFSCPVAELFPERPSVH